MKTYVKREADASATVSANEFCLRQDVPLHSAFDLGLRRTGLEIQLGIERVQFEEIAVRLTRRRTRPAVSDLSEIVSALPRAAGKLFLLRHPLRKFFCVCGNVVQNPVHPGAYGGVGIIHDERKALCLCRRIAPGKFWRDVRAVTCEFFRDGFASGKSRGGQLE